MPTTQYAKELGISPSTLLKAHAAQGHYFGAIPTKAANGRLVWPASEIARLKGGAK